MYQRNAAIQRLESDDVSLRANKMSEQTKGPTRPDPGVSHEQGDLAKKTESHTFAANGIFQLKAAALSLRRALWNRFYGRIRNFPKGSTLQDELVISRHVGSLWNRDDNPRNWRLTAGKVHNLRTAAAMIDGVEIPAGETFSFWAHVGKPTRRRGFVMGRAVREGCIVPSIAGGLCQLSNALYDAALNAGFEIVERHRHSEVIKGSLAEQDRDATIKWNYIDFRFRSSGPVRIEVDLTDKELLIRFRGKKGQKSQGVRREILRPASPLRDCYSCGQVSCASHRSIEPVTKPPTAFLLDEMWPEYDGYVRGVADGGDLFLCPVNPRIIRRRNYGWNLAGFEKVKAATLATIFRAMAVRAAAGKGGRILQSRLIAHDRKLAQHYMRQLPAECTHLVVAQNLLPYLWEAGALGGRTFDVLMYRLPLRALQERLDDAYSRNPGSPTLNDFRVPESLVELESKALGRARNIITPHAKIASMFEHQAVPLKWTLPPQTLDPGPRKIKVLLAAPPLGRKGIYEVEKLAEELKLPVIALRGATEDSTRKRSPFIETVDLIPFEEIGLVLLPAYVEHKPRIVLKAISMGIPAIASDACGLHGMPGVTTVPTGDYESLKKATINCLSSLDLGS